jgi:hypothetical protein
MDWSMIGALGKLLGAAAVVISLLYLASQIKQNTAVSRSEAFREFSIEAAKWQMSIATDERLGTLMWKVFHHRARRAKLPEEDRARVATAFMSSLYLLEASFHSAQEGIITDAELRVMVSSSQLWKLPFVSDSWHVWRNELGPDFVSYFESVYPSLLGSGSEEE